jgi:hypothetical protein
MFSHCVFSTPEFGSISMEKWDSKHATTKHVSFNGNDACGPLLSIPIDCSNRNGTSDGKLKQCDAWILTEMARCRLDSLHVLKWRGAAA